MSVSSRPTRLSFQASALGQGSLPIRADNDARMILRGRCSAEFAIPPMMKPLCGPQISSRRVFARWDPPPVLSLPNFQQLSSPLLSLPFVRPRPHRHAALCLYPRPLFPPRFPYVLLTSLSLDAWTDRDRFFFPFQSPLHSRALCLCRLSRK